MRDYIIKNGPDLPEGVDAAAFEQEDGRIVCEYSTIGDRVFIGERPLRVRRCFNSDDKSVRVCLIRKPPQPPAWNVPDVFQGEAWRGWAIEKHATGTLVILIHDGMPFCHIIGLSGHFHPLAKVAGLTPDDFTGLAPGQSVPLGPQPKPPWKCTGKLAGSGAYLTCQGDSDDLEWRLFFTKPDFLERGTWCTRGGAVACCHTEQWPLASALIGPLPDVDGVPVEERIWKL